MRALFLPLIFLPSFALAQNAPVAQGRPNVPEFAPAFAGQTRAPEQRSYAKLTVETFAAGLDRPWGITPIPGGAYLVTERGGALRVVDGTGNVSAPLGGVPRVHARGQGGLLDVAIAPDFSRNRVIYLTYSKPLGQNSSATAVARAVLAEDLKSVGEVQDIFVQTPPSPTNAHYGSRIVFDGEGRLFVTLGEHSSRRERQLAQDLGTTYGKVVRINPDGSVPRDNPFGTAVWSYGHRNPQGAAIGPDGTFWTIEHGPRGGDELNLMQVGGNYGWPVISYGENYSGSSIGKGITQAEGMEQPVYYWDPVIAPSGMAFYEGELFERWSGDLLIASLNPGGLVRLRIEGGRVTGEERFLRGTRIRDVELAPDGAVLVLVDDPKGGILRLTPQ